MQDELDFREKVALVSHSLTNWFSGSSQNCIPKSYMDAKSLTPGHNHERDHKTCFQFRLPVLTFMFLLKQLCLHDGSMRCFTGQFWKSVTWIRCDKASLTVMLPFYFTVQIIHCMEDVLPKVHIIQPNKSIIVGVSWNRYLQFDSLKLMDWKCEVRSSNFFTNEIKSSC